MKFIGSMTQKEVGLGKYINDSKKIQVVALSATIAKPENLLNGLKQSVNEKHKLLQQIIVVPLKHFILQDQEIIPTYSDGEFNFSNFNKLEKVNILSITG